VFDVFGRKDAHASWSYRSVLSYPSLESHAMAMKIIALIWLGLTLAYSRMSRRRRRHRRRLRCRHHRRTRPYSTRFAHTAGRKMRVDTNNKPAPPDPHAPQSRNSRSACLQVRQTLRRHAAELEARLRRLLPLANSLHPGTLPPAPSRRRYGSADGARRAEPPPPPPPPPRPCSSLLHPASRSVSETREARCESHPRTRARAKLAGVGFSRDTSDSPTAAPPAISRLDSFRARPDRPPAAPPCSRQPPSRPTSRRSAALSSGRGEPRADGGAREPRRPLRPAAPPPQTREPLAPRARPPPRRPAGAFRPRLPPWAGIKQRPAGPVPSLQGQRCAASWGRLGGGRLATSSLPPPTELCQGQSRGSHSPIAERRGRP
jgi:hypothetical protein